MFSLTDLCFLCLTNSKELKSILAQDIDGVVVEEKLRYFLFELVNIKPEIPKHICFHCLKDLNHVYEFKQRCLRNIIKLNNYVHSLINSQGQTQAPFKLLQVDNLNLTKSKEPQDKPETSGQTHNEVIVKRETDNEANKEFECVLLSDGQKSNIKNEDNLSYEESDSDEQTVQQEIENIVIKIEPEYIPDDDDEDDNDGQRDNGTEEDEAMNVVDDSTSSLTISNCNFKCTKCTKSFSNQLTLRRHLRSHIEEKPYKCSMCPYETIRPFDLKYHMSKHTGHKPHKCDLCGYRCARPKDMRSHMRSHTGERPYECEVCHKRFPHISNLRRHTQTHNTEKPHHCTFCSFKCAHADYLKVHVRQHTGEKPHECDVCTKRFATNSHLLRHRRFHDDNLRPHQCFGCERSFKLGSHLSKHIERAHTKSHPCGKCGRVFTGSTEMYRHRQQCELEGNVVFIKQEPV